MTTELKSVTLLRAIGYDYRLDWSDFDGRAAKQTLDAVADLIERERKGEDVSPDVDEWLEDLREREASI